MMGFRHSYGLSSEWLLWCSGGVWMFVVVLLLGML